MSSFLVYGSNAYRLRIEPRTFRSSKLSKPRCGSNSYPLSCYLHHISRKYLPTYYLCHQNVALTFQNFLTEVHWDQLKLYDGYDDQASLITRPLSGSLSTSLANRFQTTQQYLFVTFASDSSVTYGGFIATYTSKPTCYVILVYFSYISTMFMLSVDRNNGKYLFKK